MLIEEFLDEIKVPDRHPGHLSVKLKYDIKKRILLRNRRMQQYGTVATLLSVLVFLFAALMLYQPNVAVSIHNSLFVRSTDDKLEEDTGEHDASKRKQSELPLSEDGVLLGADRLSSRSSGHPNIRQVSTAPQSQSRTPYQIMELSQLEEGTPYVIRKMRDENNRYIYFVNEVATETKVRLPY